MLNSDLRTTADYLFGVADRARASGNLARPAGLEQVTEDYEAELPPPTGGN